MISQRLIKDLHWLANEIRRLAKCTFQWDIESFIYDCRKVIEINDTVKILLNKSLPQNDNSKINEGLISLIKLKNDIESIVSELDYFINNIYQRNGVFYESIEVGYNDFKESTVDGYSEVLEGIYEKQIPKLEQYYDAIIDLAARFEVSSSIAELPSYCFKSVADEPPTQKDLYLRCWHIKPFAEGGLWGEYLYFSKVRPKHGATSFPEQSTIEFIEQLIDSKPLTLDSLGSFLKTKRNVINLSEWSWDDIVYDLKLYKKDLYEKKLSGNRKRTPNNQSHIIVNTGFEFLPGQVLYNKCDLEIGGPLKREVLETLYKNIGRVVSKEDLSEITKKAVHYIGELNTLLELKEIPFHIYTITREGYKLDKKERS